MHLHVCDVFYLPAAMRKVGEARPASLPAAAAVQARLTPCTATRSEGEKSTAAAAGKLGSPLSTGKPRRRGGASWALAAAVCECAGVPVLNSGANQEKTPSIVFNPARKHLNEKQTST
jgi:hypothetical protein